MPAPATLVEREKERERERGERILAVSPAVEIAPGILHDQVTQRMQVAVRMSVTLHCGAKQRLSLAVG